MYPLVRILLLIVGTAALVALSLRSLRHPSTHGFYRFFAFEAILVLLLFNGPRWFAVPSSPLRILSWVLLAASAALAVEGFRLLHRAEHHAPVAAAGTDFQFERTSELVTTGVYRFIRHPLYASLLYLAWGAALKEVTPATLVLALVATAALTLTAEAEERENLRHFGPAYRDYRSKTKRFIPFVW